MSTLAGIARGVRLPGPTAGVDPIQRLWGVAVCGECGETIVLGETTGGRGAGLCASCRALPAIPSAASIVTARPEHDGTSLHAGIDGVRAAA
jgi:hypothetical protein